MVSNKSLSHFSALFLVLGLTSLTSCDLWNNNSGKFSRISKNYEPTPLSFCFDCITRNDVIEFEENLNSKQLKYGYFLTQRLGKNSFHPMAGYVFYPKDTIRGTHYSIYERTQSDIANFNQLAIYLFQSNDTVISINSMRFYLGSNPFGYWPNPVEAVDPYSIELDRGQLISLDSFQKAYYSVISWLHSQEDFEYELYSSRDNIIYDNYSSTGNIKYGEYEFEENWQKEFFFELYYLKSDLSPEHWKYTLEGMTHAPMRAYASKDNNGFLEPYEIRIQDMAISITYYNKNIPQY